VSLAALIAVRPGCGPRLIFRTHRARRGDKRKGFTETDYARFLDAVHQQLGGPLVLVWDNLNTHTSGAMAELIAARDWLTVFQLPPYASELNPVEPVWSNLKRSLANLVKQDIGQLIALVAEPTGRSLEGKKRHVVQAVIPGAGHFRREDLHDEHLGEELNVGRQQVARVGRRRVFLESDGDMNMRENPVGIIPGDRAAPEGFDVRYMHLRPYRGLRIFELLAGAD
jgi:transposase